MTDIVANIYFVDSNESPGEPPWKIAFGSCRRVHGANRFQHGRLQIWGLLLQCPYEDATILAGMGFQSSTPIRSRRCPKWSRTLACSFLDKQRHAQCLQWTPLQRRISGVSILVAKGPEAIAFRERELVSKRRFVLNTKCLGRLSTRF